MDRIITVTEGTGTDFKKVEMLESEFNAKNKRTSDIPLQTEYEERALDGGWGEDSAKGAQQQPASEGETLESLIKMSRGDLNKLAIERGVEGADGLANREEVAKAIVEKAK